MDDLKRFVSNFGWVGISNFLVAISSLILLPILTKNLNISDYGIYILINVSVSLIPLITTLSLNYSMVRFLAASKEKKDIQEGFYSILFTTLLISLFLSLLLYLFSGAISTYLFNNNYTVALLLPIVTFIASLNAIIYSYFTTFQRMKVYSLFILINTYLNVFLIVYFVILGFNIFGVVISLLISQIVIFLIMMLIIVKEIGIKLPKFKEIKKYLSFSLPLVPGNLSYWVVDLIDRYVIGILLGTAYVGYYSPGYTLGNLIGMLSIPMFTALLPMISKSYENNEIKEVKNLIDYCLKYFLILALPAALALSILSKPILTILTTPEIALNGYLITPIVAFSALIFGIGLIIGQILILKHKTKIIGISWIIAATINLILNIILVKIFGIIAAAFVTLMAYLFVSTILIHYSNKYIKINAEFSSIIKIIFASIIFSLIIIKIDPRDIISILIVVTIAFVIYIIILFLLKAIGRDEINLFKHLLGSK